MMNLPLTTIVVSFLVVSGMVALRHHAAEQRGILLQDLQLTRQRLFWSVEEATHSQLALEQSSLTNGELAACLNQNSDGVPDCPGASAKPRKVSLLSADGKKLTGAGALFNWAGENCLSTNCPISSSATFQPRCANDAAQCDRAESIRFEVKFKLDGTKVKRLSRERMGDFGSGGTFTTTFVSYFADKRKP